MIFCRKSYKTINDLINDLIDLILGLAKTIGSSLLQLFRSRFSNSMCTKMIPSMDIFLP